MMNEKVYLSLGSNMGDKKEILISAISELSSNGINITDVSSVYQTEPIGFQDQDDFLNMIVIGETDKDPHEVLYICQEIEEKLDRVRTIRWGPRTIDIDIILFGQRTVRNGELVIPHPRFKERAFVLVPLKELEPKLYNSLKINMPKEKVSLKIKRSDVILKLRKRNILIKR